MRKEKLYDFAPILNNSIHIRIFNPSIFASTKETENKISPMEESILFLV